MTLVGLRPVRPVVKARGPAGTPPNEAEVRRIVAEIIDAMVASVTLNDLARAAAAFPAAVDVPLTLPDHAALTDALAAAILTEGRREARRGITVTKATGRLVLSFDLNDPAAIRWAERRAAALVVEIGRSTREAIRALIVRAAREGGAPMEVARAIRSLIGLHSRWATAVLNYRYRLEAAGQAATRVEELTARYYARLLTTRARTIARTETLAAANNGKMLAWTQAERQGLFGGRDVFKRWEAAADAEPSCASLDGTEVPLHDVFSSPMGTAESPPLHPSCRCTVVVVTYEKKK